MEEISGHFVFKLVVGLDVSRARTVLYFIVRLCSDNHFMYCSVSVYGILQIMSKLKYDIRQCVVRFFFMEGFLSCSFFVLCEVFTLVFFSGVRLCVII